MHWIWLAGLIAMQKNLYATYFLRNDVPLTQDHLQASVTAVYIGKFSTKKEGLWSVLLFLGDIHLTL